MVLVEVGELLLDVLVGESEARAVEAALGALSRPIETVGTAAAEGIEGTVPAGGTKTGRPGTGAAPASAAPPGYGNKGPMPGTGGDERKGKGGKGGNNPFRGGDKPKN